MFATLQYGTRFRIGDQEYEIRKLKEDDEFEVYNMSYDTIELISLEEIKIAVNETKTSKRLIFHQDSDDPLKITAKWDLDLYTSEEKSEKDKRFEIIKPYISGSIKNVKNYIENLPTELLPKSTTKLSLATFYRWIKMYRKHGNKMCLTPLSTGPKDRRISEEVIDRLREFIKETDKKAEAQTIRNKWLLYIDRVKNDNLFRDEKGKIPLMSESTFRRIYREMHNPRSRNVHIMGIAQADLAENGVRGAINPDRPLEYVELDWTPLDFITVNFGTGETFRPVILYAVDKYSDEPLAFRPIFKEQPNAGDLKQLLLQIMLPKTGIKELYPYVQSEWSGFGVPENIILDNASVNDCEELAEVCGEIGIGLIYNEKGSGHQKGTVENGLGSMNKTFHSLPGTTFSNPEERGQYDSSKKACVDMNGLYHMLHVYFIDLVANKYNRGVGGKPEELWHEGLRNAKVQRRLPHRRENLELLFATQTAYRVLGRKGIEFKGEFFYSEEVNQLRLRIEREGRDRKVRIRYGSDVRNIYVYDEFNDEYLRAKLKQSSRLNRYKIDQRYPVHVEHLAHLCNKNNSEANNFLKEQENVTHGLKVLELLASEGKKEYSRTKRQRRMEEAQKTSLVSAITGSRDTSARVPDDPNIIIVESDPQTDSSESTKEAFDSNQLDAAEMSSVITSDEVDLKKINANWSTGRKER
ncbi:MULTISPECIES: hypothetical protein [Paenibacillus]|nr:MULTISPECIES: hypothetical protein [Paenibacillus]MBJ9989264.1 hypothetical protein [Paenibacillus sp. S28]